MFGRAILTEDLLHVRKETFGILTSTRQRVVYSEARVS